MYERLQQRISDGPAPRLWVVGDVMLDRYLAGGVERISPEAPVPVLRLERSWDRLGGAANVAQNVVALGGLVALGGVRGDDEPGAALARLLAEAGIDPAPLAVQPGHPTTVKTRALQGAHQLLRIDHEKRTHLDAAAIASLIARLQAALPPDLIVVSDYDKGVVSAELVAALGAAAPGVPLLVDPKGHDYTRYRGCALLTPNEREAQLASGVAISDDDSAVAAGRALQRIVPGADLVITRGARGMTLCSRDGEVVHSPARARRTFDVTGAGDTAIAALAMARGYGLPWDAALHLANAAAGIAVGKIGAAPVYRTELLAALGHEELTVKTLDRAGLAELRRTTTALGQRLVFTNGCFDLLHVGHLRLLQAARSLGDVLLVAINSDASVRRLKGPERPLCPQADRAALLAGLEAVDFVTIFDEDTPLEAILACRPDVLVKGGDYTRASIVGAPEVESWGGRVDTIPLVAGRSTSAMIARMAPPPAAARAPGSAGGE